MFGVTLIHRIVCGNFNNFFDEAGIIEFIFEKQPRYLLVDKIDKLSRQNQAFLFNLMETGILSETKYGKTRQTEIKTSVFATSNDPRKLSVPLLSRFFVVDLKPYTYEKFYEITVRLLGPNRKIARIIADAVWITSRNLRDCVRIGALAITEDDVKFLLDKFIAPDQRSVIENE